MGLEAGAHYDSSSGEGIQRGSQATLLEQDVTGCAGGICGRQIGPRSSFSSQERKASAILLSAIAENYNQHLKEQELQVKIGIILSRQ